MHLVLFLMLHISVLHHQAVAVGPKEVFCGAEVNPRYGALYKG